MITQQELGVLITQREAEVSSYETNYNNYTLMIEAMGGLELSEELQEYIGKEDSEVPLSVSIEDSQLISNYNYLEKIKKLQRSELLEMNKVKVLLDVLKGQLEEVVEETTD